MKKYIQKGKDEKQGKSNIATPVQQPEIEVIHLPNIYGQKKVCLFQIFFPLKKQLFMETNVSTYI